MDKKLAAAKQAVQEIKPDLVVGIGTGSTVNCLIDLLPLVDTPKYFVSSSEATTDRLKALGFEVRSLNEAGRLDVYIDGADQVLSSKVALKGGGGAHTLEKLLAVNANTFVGMISDDKLVTSFDFPLVVEVLEEAQAAVSRTLVGMGASPMLRQGYTDLGNKILDVVGLDLKDPESLESALIQICGVVEVGLFAKRRFDKIYIASQETVQLL